jgi:hypothetical protein
MQVVSGYLSDNITMEVIKAPVAAGASQQTSSAIDMLGYDGVLIWARLGTPDDTNSIKAQQSSDDAATDAYDDLAGTSVVTGTAGSNENVWLDIKQPSKRYLKVVATRTVSTTLDFIIAMKYRARALPITNVLAGTILGEQYTAPAEGTA